MTEREDPGIAWIRDVRHKISAEFDHDPQKLAEHYRELEKKYTDRLEPMIEREKNTQILTKQ